MSRLRKDPQPRQRPGVPSKPHSSFSKETPLRVTSGRGKNQPAEIYDPDEVKATATEADPSQEDYEGRICRALWIHRWLPAPDKSRKAQLKGGGSSWPTPVQDWHQYGWEGRGPRPRFSPREISDHDHIFGIPPAGSFSWFRCLSKRSFEILWQHDALKWSFRKIGDKYGMSRQRAHVVYGQALKAVVTEAIRGDHEI